MRGTPVASDRPATGRIHRPRSGLLAAADRVRGQAGNTLVLFPAAVLILFGLGAVAIDSATIFLAQRRLADLSAAIANDAVSGVDLASFYGNADAIRLDGDRGTARAEQLRSAQSQDRAFEEVACTVEVTGDTATATCRGLVRPILASLWSTDERRQLTATEAAVGLQN